MLVNLNTTGRSNTATGQSQKKLNHPKTKITACPEGYGFALFYKRLEKAPLKYLPKITNWAC